MTGQWADEMLNRHRAADQPRQKASITLDAETLRLAEKWSVGNLKDTIAFFAKVADECLSERDKRPVEDADKRVTAPPAR